MLEGPFAAGEKVARTAAFRGDRPLASAGDLRKIHKATAAGASGELPASGELDGRRLRRWWRGRRCGDLRGRLRMAGAAAGGRKGQDDSAGFRYASCPRRYVPQSRHGQLNIPNWDRKENVKAPGENPEASRNAPLWPIFPNGDYHDPLSR